jgi:hypothetical protein
MHAPIVRIPIVAHLPTTVRQLQRYARHAEIAIGNIQTTLVRDQWIDQTVDDASAFCEQARSLFVDGSYLTADMKKDLTDVSWAAEAVIKRTRDRFIANCFRRIQEAAERLHALRPQQRYRIGRIMRWQPHEEPPDHIKKTRLFRYDWDLPNGGDYASPLMTLLGRHFLYVLGSTIWARIAYGGEFLHIGQETTRTGLGVIAGLLVYANPDTLADPTGLGSAESGLLPLEPKEYRITSHGIFLR